MDNFDIKLKEEKTKLKKSIIIGIIVALLIAIIVILGIKMNLKTKDNKNTASQTTEVRVTEVTRSVFYAPQYAAIELGYFEEEGIDIELTTGSGADSVMTAVLARSM